MNELKAIVEELKHADPAQAPALIRRARGELDQIERELAAPEGKIRTIEELRLKGPKDAS